MITIFYDGEIVNPVGSVAIVTDDLDLLEELIDRYDVRIRNAIDKYDYGAAKEYIDAHEELEKAYKKLKGEIL